MKKILGMTAAVLFILACVGGVVYFWPHAEPPAPEPKTPFSASSPKQFTGDISSMDPGFIGGDGVDHGGGNGGTDSDATLGREPYPESRHDKNVISDSADAGVNARAEANSKGYQVSIPTLDMHVPVLSAGTHQLGFEDGSQVEGLNLPAPPWAAWWNQTQPIGSDEGNTLIAGHVDYGSGAMAPFSRLNEIKKGEPIFVRDSSGEVFTYEAESIKLYSRRGIPPDSFRVGGDPHLVLVTCSGPFIGSGPQAGLGYMYNLVVTATPVK